MTEFEKLVIKGNMIQAITQSEAGGFKLSRFLLSDMIEFNFDVAVEADKDCFKVFLTLNFTDVFNQNHQLSFCNRIPYTLELLIKQVFYNFHKFLSGLTVKGRIPYYKDIPEEMSPVVMKIIQEYINYARTAYNKTFGKDVPSNESLIRLLGNDSQEVNDLYDIFYFVKYAYYETYQPDYEITQKELIVFISDALRSNPISNIFKVMFSNSNVIKIKDVPEHPLMGTVLKIKEKMLETKPTSLVEYLK